MRRQQKLFLISIFLLISLILSSVFTPANVQAQDTPAHIRQTAIDALNIAMPQIGQPDSWRHVGPAGIQSSDLGCVGAPTLTLNRPVLYYQVWLTYAEVEYQINVNEDGTLFVYCDSKIPGSFNYSGTTTPPSDSATCPIGLSGFMQPRFTIADQIKVEEGGLANRVRSTPSTSGEILFQLEPGTEATVTDGPECENGIVWWQIETEALQTGWTAESNVVEQDYYLVPILQPLGISEGLVSQGNISFQFPTDLASDVAYSEVDPVARTEPDTPPFPYHPGYREFTFIDFVVENDFDPPAAYIRVYPTATMETYNEFMADQWVILEEVLANQADYPADTIVTVYDGINDNEMPTLPMRYAAQVFATQIRFVEFENGVGVRYLTRYAQGIFGTGNDQVFYTFQGLTTDNAYYVIVDIPVSTTLLPDKWEPTDDTDFENIGAEDSLVIEQLMQADAADFTPDLSVLDEFVATLTVE